jgi:hypothetical protein
MPEVVTVTRSGQRWSGLRRLAAVAVVLGAAAACGGAIVATSGAAAPAHRATVRDALRGDGAGAATFGEKAGVAIHRLRRLLGRAPVEPFAVAGACRVDHVSRWRTLTAYFSKGRFVGYAYQPHRHVGGTALATGRRLRVGDRLARGRALYGGAFHRSSAQGGSWSVHTRRGRLIGYASGLPVGPHSTVATIEAGDVGCPAMTP